MNFDNIYKAGKAFLFFSVGIFVLTLSISLWRDGNGGCHKIKWHGKYGHGCSKIHDVGVEVFAFDDEDIDIKNLDELLKK
jgi:hypothetical protein